MGHAMLRASREGRELDMETAYQEACRSLGLAVQTPQQAEAARRAAVAKARAASTPRTASSRSAPAEDDDGGNESIEQTLRSELTKREAALRARI
jgi:hypothetical protein